MTSDDEDDVMNATRELDGRRNGRMATTSSKSPRSARRESFRRQQNAVPDSPPTSSERDYDGNDPTGTPSSHSSFPHSDAEAVSYTHLTLPTSDLV